MPDSRTVRIEDLRSPELTDAQRRAVEFGETYEVDLATSALVEAARTATGLHDLGNESVIERLSAQCAAVDADDGLSGLGRLIVRQRLVALLCSRLRLVDFQRRYPEALDVELAPPVIVVGLPRSGTTHLVNTLAADDRFRSLPWWEVQEPVPILGEGPGRDGVDPRFARALAAYEAEREIAPLTAAMHDRRPDAIEEECELLDLDFAAYVLEWHARVPGWRDHYLELDQDAHYAYLVDALRTLTFLRGPRRWVLKSPQHLEQLGPLLRAFPEATVVFTHRDPVAVIQSTAAMLAYGDRVRRRRVDVDELVAYWVDRIERLLRAYVHDREVVPTGRRLDVAFGDFMADQAGTIDEVYLRATLPLTDVARRSIGAHLAAHPRGEHGSVQYDFEGDFGLDAQEVRSRFDFYLDAVAGIAPEV